MKYKLTPADEETLAFLRREEISLVSGFTDRYRQASAALYQAADRAAFYAVFSELRDSARFGVQGDDTLDFRVVNAVLRQLNEDIDAGKIRLPEQGQWNVEPSGHDYSPLANLN